MTPAIFVSDTILREFCYTGEPAPKRKRLADLGRDATVEVSYEGLTRFAPHQ